MPESVSEHALSRFKSQMRRGEVVLFLGAGFSMGATSTTGLQLPSATELARDLWDGAFPSLPFDEESSLGDVFHVARQRNPARTRETLRRRLEVDPASIPDWYEQWFAAPWTQCYTLNIDDLALAAARRFALPRAVHAVSATSDRNLSPGDPAALNVVHLNGALSDDLAHLTFSERDYGGRQASPDRWLQACAADVLSRPVVFVGTSLAEPPLWQYIALRQSRGSRGTREYRPGSFLVSPNVPIARRAFLEELNIDWLPMGAEDFAREVLTGLEEEKAEGLQTLADRAGRARRSETPDRVSDLIARSPAPNPDYLLGEEPGWSDVTEGVAAVREADDQIYEFARDVLSGDAPGPPLLLSGTAGSGKSTSLMRLALRLNADGIPTYWIDERSNVDPHGLRRIPSETTGPVAILVDDADLWGDFAAGWLREIANLRAGVFFGAAMRASRVTGRFDAEALESEVAEISMPLLSDGDIRAILDTLSAHNRLGVLRGMNTGERIETFRRLAGRQLIVAMIEATSGQQFREKIYEEFAELHPEERLLYAIAALASSQRYTLDREEMLISFGDPTNEIISALESLVTRGLILRDDRYSGYRSRHRVIAEEVAYDMARRQVAEEAMRGICFAFATRVRADMPRTSRPWRRLIRFTNHEFVGRMVGAAVGRDIYRALEEMLEWDYQFWLQRGSLEVEEGDLDLATNFLGQALSMAPEQPQVETEYGYLLLKKAASRPLHPDAERWFDEGKNVLTGLIARRGRRDAYPYHVLGSQTLSWTRQAQLSLARRREILREAVEIIDEGERFHPRADDIRVLARDLRAELLRTAASDAH